MQYLGHTYIKKLFIVYLKFRFNWASSVLSGNPRECMCVGGGRCQKVAVMTWHMVPLTNRWILIGQMRLCFGAGSSEEHQLVRTPWAKLESNPGLPICSPGRILPSLPPAHPWSFSISAALGGQEKAGSRGSLEG